MPAGRSETGASSGGGGAGTNSSGGTAAAGRGASFKPPWVKEGPNPLPMPKTPWTLNKRGSVVKENSDTAEVPTSKKPPSKPSENGTAKDPHTFERPKLREVSKQTPTAPTAPSPKEPTTKLQSREIKVPVAVTRKDSSTKDLPSKLHIDTSKKRESIDERRDSYDDRERRVSRPEIPKVELRPVKRDETKPPKKDDENPNIKVDLRPVKRDDSEKKKKEEGLPKVELRPVKRRSVTIDDQAKNEPIDKVIPSERNAIVRQESMKKLFPAPPPMPPPPPPPPPTELPFKPRDPLSRSQIDKLEQLRARPRKRPDWGTMMKEVEAGKKLKHVECNDRSSPLLPDNKAVEGQYIYESETPNLHNELLKQIQKGRNLKHVKTNDRSKPILEGLRKFRRQMTIEEQIQKSQSIANMSEADQVVEEEIDEMDDIDKIRDDLQSTKQMLALELRNKEAQIRENKRLQSRLSSLESELEKLRDELESTQNNLDASSDNSTTKTSAKSSPADDKIVKTLKEEASTAKKNAQEMEKKYHDTADQLDGVKTDLDEAKRQNQILEKKLQQALQGQGVKRQSISERRESAAQPPESEESEEEITESESESDGEDNEEKQKRRAERELRLLRNKLKSLKNKQEAAKVERKNLRDQMKKHQKAIKDEKKRYRSIQKEVNKMASLMKDDDEDEDEEEEEAEEEEEETEEEESDTESESESSDEEESSESEDEDAAFDKRKTNLDKRVKRHDNCLNALKKGNYMLKANVDRMQDDLNKQKEMVVSLQEDLDSVLAELG